MLKVILLSVLIGSVIAQSGSNSTYSTPDGLLRQINNSIAEMEKENSQGKNDGSFKSRKNALLEIYDALINIKNGNLPIGNGSTDIKNKNISIENYPVVEENDSQESNFEESESFEQWVRTLKTNIPLGSENLAKNIDAKIFDHSEANKNLDIDYENQGLILDMDYKIYYNSNHYLQMILDKIDEAKTSTSSGVHYDNCLKLKQNKGYLIDQVRMNAQKKLGSMRKTNDTEILNLQKKYIIDYEITANNTLNKIKNEAFKCIENLSINYEKHEV